MEEEVGSARDGEEGKGMEISKKSRDSGVD